MSEALEALNKLCDLAMCGDLQFHKRHNIWARFQGVEKYKPAIETELIKMKILEEELGVDLTTLLKALKNGIYVKDLKGKIHFVRPHLRMVTNIHLGLEFQCPIKWRYIQLPEDRKDYGKTWALTKEELL